MTAIALQAGQLTCAELAHALDLAADLARVDYGDDEPMVARLLAGAERIRQEAAR